jgi:hypothetical protein
MAYDGMAASGVHVNEAGRLQCTKDLANRKIGERGTHAAPATWNEVTNGVLVIRCSGSSISSR